MCVAPSTSFSNATASKSPNTVGNRALAARWLGQEVVDGRLYRLDTGTLSVLVYERETPVIERWNA